MQRFNSTLGCFVHFHVLVPDGLFLHTNSASETITRLLDMGLEPFNFGDALLGVLAQRLTRTLCKACRESYPGTRGVGRDRGAVRG